jgi:hypothetical protein
MRESDNKGFFGVVVDPQSYLNILYLMLAFPLGTIYFVFLVTGLSVGFGLLITLIGIPILLLVLGGSWALCGFERGIAAVLLKEEIPSSSVPPASKGLWARLMAHLTDRVTWTGMLYLFLKFPIGITTFTIAVTLVSVTLGLLFAPAYAWTSDPITWGAWVFDPFPWSWVATLVGIPMIFISLHLMNGIALLSGRMARVLIGKS